MSMASSKGSYRSHPAAADLCDVETTTEKTRLEELPNERPAAPLALQLWFPLGKRFGNIGFDLPKNPWRLWQEPSSKLSV